MKTQITIPQGLTRAELRKEIIRQQAEIIKLFQPLLDDAEHREFEDPVDLAFLRDVPRQAVQIVYEWVRMDYATSKQTCVRIQFKGNLYEVQVVFKK